MANKGMELYGWCIMTSHIHITTGLHADKLERIMQNMKRHTSEGLKAAIKNDYGESRKEWMLWLMERAGKKNSNNINFQLWQQHNQPVELSSQKMAWQKLEYIHQNPVKAGFVEKAEDYLYSSARDYYGMKGLIDISYLDHLIITEQGISTLQHKPGCILAPDGTSNYFNSFSSNHCSCNTPNCD